MQMPLSVGHEQAGLCETEVKFWKSAKGPEKRADFANECLRDAKDARRDSDALTSWTFRQLAFRTNAAIDRAILRLAIH